MVRGVLPNNTIPDLSLSSVNTTAGRKLSLPVEPSALIYSHMRYVSGVPAPEGSQGITISKLNMLDVLIEQMNKIKKPAVSPAPAKSDQLDSMLNAFKANFRRAKAANEAMPYNPPPQAPSGVMLRLKA